MANIDQLDPLLQSLQALKPPGASKTKIASITTLCVDNVQSESIICQRLYRHLKRTPGTHKLGVLYVIDSVTRQWIEKTRQSGQDLSGSAAPEGTFTSGVHRITELLPALIDDLIQTAPTDHKAKVENLIQIWERGNTFPLKMLADVKRKLTEPAPAPYVPSSTPPGSPPMNLLVSLGLRQPLKTDIAPKPAVNAPALSAAQPDASSILAALAGLQPMPAMSAPLPAPAAPASSAPPVYHAQAAPPTSSAQDLASMLAGIGQPYQAAPPSAAPQQTYGHPYQVPAPANPPAPVAPQHNFLPYHQAPTPVQQAPQQVASAQNPLNALASFLPPHVMNNPVVLNQVLNLLQGLQVEGIPQEQWGAVIVALFPAPQDNNASVPTPTSWGAASQDNYPQRTDSYAGFRDRSRERDRRRSRSPEFRGQKPANRRASPVYGTYDASIANTENDHQQQHFSEKRGRGRGGRNNYRQRSPPPNRNTHQDLPIVSHGTGPKWTDIDPSLPAGHIKVLSRTLFVGGASGTEADLRAIFSRFGQVQTCIANEDKRHAFVKMSTRNDAVSAKTAMENMRDPEVLSKARQTKWGVGFGPRECCDYSTGISVIPIDTLTDADHKWMLSAEYGGTGGRPIESGLVVEEPDIEIGAGVSSKAMSRRVGPDGGNRRSRGGSGGGGGGGGRFRQPDRESPRPDPVTIPPPPPVPGFGFNFAMPGMPQFQ